MSFCIAISQAVTTRTKRIKHKHTPNIKQQPKIYSQKEDKGTMWLGSLHFSLLILLKIHFCLYSWFECSIPSKYDQCSTLVYVWMDTKKETSNILLIAWINNKWHEQRHSQKKRVVRRRKEYNTRKKNRRRHWRNHHHDRSLDFTLIL